MPNSLLTGVSGLLSHQRMLDVTGNNIANANTTAYKSQRILFSDLLYETVRPASSASEGNTGGMNPNQIGSGVKVAAVDRKLGQGALESTGDNYDLALSGGGYFVVTDGESDFYTRAGAFSLDEAGKLVTPTGLLVKRFGNIGEGDVNNPMFQTSGDDTITVPIGASIEGIETSSAVISGNLNAALEGATTNVISSNAAFESGTVPVTSATLLNSLDNSTIPFAPGDIVHIDATQNDGTRVTSAFSVDGTTTMQDLMNAINAQLPSATATLAGDGTINITSNEPGQANVGVTLRQDAANTGSLNLSSHGFQTTTVGEDAGETRLVFTVYDPQGGQHDITATFSKADDDTWMMSASVNEDSGTIIDGQIDNIQFTDEGQFLSSSDTDISILFAGQAIPQTINFSLGDASNPLTHFRTASALKPAANGSPPGSLTGIRVDQSGLIKALSSNGREYDLAQLSVASFQNPKGLESLADNLYSISLNSGDAEIGEGMSGGRGQVIGGQLESSNVDIALEFTRLIVAQRGFSANARTITVSDEVLEELTSIIR